MKRIKKLVIVLQIGLIISGLTAFFIPQGVHILVSDIKLGLLINKVEWLNHVDQGVQHIENHYPFMYYGTDWMAFAHLLFAILFYGLYKDPIRNQWLVKFGLIASVAIFPLALILGPIRQIPLIWQLLDCSFGVVSGAILLYINKLLNKITQNSHL